MSDHPHPGLVLFVRDVRGVTAFYMNLATMTLAHEDADHAVAAAHGGAVQPAAREWEARGFRACDGHDPEGNIFQVRERAG
jgi:predicted enzyme related to lactoylglutathione lyase